MSIVSSIFKLFGAILKKIFRFVLNFIKKFWWVILIIALIYFAPVIVAYLTSIGAPSWLTTAFTWLSGATPYVTSVVNSIISGASWIGTSVWNAFASASLGTQLSVAVGASMLIAPEETSQVISDTASLITDVTGSVIGGVVSAIPSTVWWTVAAVGGLFLIGRNRRADPATFGDSP